MMVEVKQLNDARRLETLRQCAVSWVIVRELIGRKLSRYCKMLNCPTDFLRPGGSNSKAMAHEALSYT